MGLKEEGHGATSHRSMGKRYPPPPARTTVKALKTTEATPPVVQTRELYAHTDSKARMHDTCLRMYIKTALSRQSAKTLHTDSLRLEEVAKEPYRSGTGAVCASVLGSLRPRSLRFIVLVCGIHSCICGLQLHWCSKEDVIKLHCAGNGVVGGNGSFACTEVPGTPQAIFRLQ